MRQWLWRAAQWIIAPRCGSAIRRRVRDQLQPLGSGCWLDVGCGPRSRVARALPGMLVGVDISLECLSGTGRGGVAAVCASATSLPFATGCFNGVVCIGLLHHLSPEDAAAALLEMRRVVRLGGTVLLNDGVRPRSVLRRPLAAALRAVDRGRYMRSEAVLRRLLDAQGFSVGRRATYSWTGLEACWATFVRQVDPVRKAGCR